MVECTIYIKGQITGVTAAGANEIMRLRNLLDKRNKQIRKLKEKWTTEQECSSNDPHQVERGTKR